MLEITDIILFFILIVVAFIGLSCLQIFSLRRKKKWVGSIILVINILVSYFFITPYVFEIYKIHYQENWIRFGVFTPWIIFFIFLILPTAINAGIYLLFLHKEKKILNDLNQLNKMSVQDLD